MIKRSKRPAGYTIIELITVLGIIMMLIGLLAPALGKVRRQAKLVKQNAQFHSIETALELYKNEFGTYPDSDALDPAGTSYCGAMKLCEAMVGQDLLGVHPSTVFNITGLGSGTTPPDLYPEPFNPETDPIHLANLRSRRGPYLPTDSATIHAVDHIYSTSTFPITGFAGFGPTVICDEYPRTTSSMPPTMLNQKIVEAVGMPVLYYRANTSKVLHNSAILTDNIYNSNDNQTLINLGVPWGTATDLHPIELTGDPGPTGFYTMIQDNNVGTALRPQNPNSFILISAGYDGFYGTSDDVFNFGR